MSKKKVKMIVLFIVVILLFGLFCLSSIIINSTSDWVESNKRVSEDDTDTDTDLVNEEEEESKESIVLDSGVRLYDNKGSVEIQLMDGLNEEYVRVCNQICNLSDSLFNDISDEDSGNIGEMQYIRSIDNDTLGLPDFPKEGYDSFFIEESLKVVALYGGRYAITIYNYDSGFSNEFVVIDYNDVVILNEVDDSVSLGSNISLKGVKEKCKSVPILDSYVLFVKG